MEAKWTSGCTRFPAHNISAHCLASSTNIFSDGFIRCLGTDLELNRDQLARELGFSARAQVRWAGHVVCMPDINKRIPKQLMYDELRRGKRPACGQEERFKDSLKKHGTADELYSWCNSPGSTVFVLVSVLANLGRTDCVKKIEQYIHLQTMQLFIKVEAAVTEQRPMTGGPLFQQIITSCEFSLLQALENVLGQDVIYYEIVGPGSWVTWNTSAKELKGQQLTLLHHSQPVPHTRAALCENKEPDTELKQPVVTRNIPAITNVTSDSETFVKANLCTEMESLKYSPEPSNQISNSNNISLSGSLDLEKLVLKSLSAERPNKTHSHPSLGSKDDQLSSDLQTQVNGLIEGNQNTPEYASVIKHFPDKCLYKDNESKDSNPDVPIYQAFDNVPNLSLLNDEFSSLLPNIQSQPLHPSLDSKNCKFTAEDKTQGKALIAGKQNTSEYPQVIKHFPDKLLYKDTESKDNKQELLMIQQALENVPRLSLLEDEFSSLSPNIQRPTLPVTHEERQDKMNNLNCGAPSFARISMNPQTVSKIYDSEAKPETGVISTHQQTHSCGYNRPKDVEPAIPTPALSQTYGREIEMHHTVSSLSPQGRTAQKINVPKVLTSQNCFFKAGFQPIGMQLFQNGSSPLENDSPLLCENSCIVTTPPQKRHRLGYTTLISSIPAEQQMQPHSQLQQQTLLDVQALKLKQLQIQQLHHQQQVPGLQQIPDTDLTNVTGSPHQQPWPQQMQSQFNQNDEVHHLHEQQQNNCPDKSHPREHTQSFIPAPQELEQQTFHLVQKSQQLLYPQQLHNEESHQDIQSSNPTFIKTKPSPFLNSNASPYLICHTPPPGFPEEQLDKNNYRVFGEAEKLTIESQIFEMAIPNQEISAPSHFVGKLGHVTKMNTKEYMAMSQPAANNSGNPGMIPHHYFEQFVALRNVEFPDTNLTNPFQSSGNHIRRESRSDSSGISADCPTLFHGEHSALFFRGQNTFMTPQPFYPAPPIFDALGRRINASAIPFDDISRKGFGEINQPHSDGYNYANKRQFSGSKVLSSNHFQATSMPSNLNSEEALLQLDGWCQHENGDTIQHTMEKFKSQDGNYIIWKSRRFKKLIISVSYVNQLFHFRVDEIKCENSDRILYYLFEGGYKSESLLDLFQHYRQNGIRISVQSRGSTKTYIEHIQLRCPLKVKLEMKRKDTSRSK